MLTDPDTELVAALDQQQSVTAQGEVNTEVLSASKKQTNKQTNQPTHNLQYFWTYFFSEKGKL